MIHGVVVDTNGQPVAGVTLQASGAISPTTTDAKGAYALGIVRGWSGSVTPSLPGHMFVPGSRTYPIVNASVSNQNYLVVTTIAPSLQNGRIDGGNYVLTWHGMAGVTYQASWSSNLVDWFFYGGPMNGNNSTMELLVPVETRPMMFFRLGARN